MGSSILVTVDKSFTKNENVLIIHKVPTIADKKFIRMLLDIVSLSENREKVSGLSENRKKFWVSLRIEKKFWVM